MFRKSKNGSQAYEAKKHGKTARQLGGDWAKDPTGCEKNPLRGKKGR